MKIFDGRAAVGALAGAACGAAGLLPAPFGAVFLRSVFLLATPLAERSLPAAALCGAAWAAACLLLPVFFSDFPPVLLLPELAAFGALVVFPAQRRARVRRREEEAREQVEMQRKDLKARREALNLLKRENQRFERQLRDVGRLYDLMRDAGATLSVQEMVQLARTNAERMFDLEHFVLGLLSDDGQRLQAAAVSGCDEGVLSGWEAPSGGREFAARLLREKGDSIVEDAAAEERWANLAALGVRSFAFLPFRVRDQAIGFFCTWSRKPAAFGTDTVTNLQVFCNQVAIGLQKTLLYERVQRLSITDGLTKLHSFRYFRQRLEEEIDLARRYRSELSLVLFDIDHFKRYNDTYGHLAGDQVLQEVAGILRREAESAHLVARYGGEEMVVMAPETRKEKALELAERIRARVEAHVVPVGAETTRVTVSAGVASFPRDADGAVPLIEQADQALYRAKEAGRNRVVEASKRS